MRNRPFTELRLAVDDNEFFHFGQRVYVVSSNESKTFRDKCPVCDDTHKINVRGFEFTCPHCSAYNSSSRSTTYTVYDYVVDEYIINKLTISGEEVMSAYNKDGSVRDGRYPRVQYSGFTRWSAAANAVSTKKFCELDFTISHSVDMFGRSDACFLNKKDADKFARQLHLRQKEVLAQFCEEHDVEHEYPFSF